MKLTGAELFTTLLEQQGITHIAGIPGGANLPLYDALSHSTSITHILTRHEQGAGFIAQGMARVTGKPGVCMATSGPGAMNILTALADAKLDSVPVVCFTGQVPTAMIGTDAFQEVDTYGLSIPITKHNFLVRTTEELLEVIPEAFRIAASGRPGPVLVDIPRDVQTGTIECDAIPAPGTAEAPAQPDTTEITRAAELINTAKRPVLILGGGIITAQAWEEAQTLARTASMPITMTMNGLGAIPADDPLSLGMLGMHGARCTNLALHECDLIVAAGARFDDRATGMADQFCPEAKIVHIDIDPVEIGKIKTTHAPVSGDVRLALQALLPQVHPAEATRASWLERIAELKEAHPARFAGMDDPTTPYGIIRHAAGIAGPNAIVCTDVGQHQMRVTQAYPFSRPRRWLSSGGLGTMGFGLPAAIGASLAEPEATVLCFTGDGSIMMNIQELATAVEHNTNIKIILTNNKALGLVRQQQDLFCNGNRFASDFAVVPDFAALAQAFGMKAIDLADCANPGAALQAGITAPGPRLIHAPIDAAELVFPMVPPGAPNTNMIEGVSNV